MENFTLGLGKFTPMKEVREKQILQDMRLFVLSLVSRNGDTFLSLGNGSQKWFVNAGVHCCRSLLFSLFLNILNSFFYSMCVFTTWPEWTM